MTQAEQLVTITEEVNHSLNPFEHERIFYLMGQLTTRDINPQEVMLNTEKVIANPYQKLFVAKMGELIIGTAIITIKPTPIDTSGYVDSVVVDNEYRGNGVGGALMRQITEIADKEDFELQLTSSDKRQPAISLYRELGFKRKDTNFFIRTPHEDTTQSK